MVHPKGKETDGCAKERYSHHDSNGTPTTSSHEPSEKVRRRGVPGRYCLLQGRPEEGILRVWVCAALQEEEEGAVLAPCCCQVLGRHEGGRGEEEWGQGREGEGRGLNKGEASSVFGFASRSKRKRRERS